MGCYSAWEDSAQGAAQKRPWQITVITQTRCPQSLAGSWGNGGQPPPGVRRETRPLGRRWGPTGDPIHSLAPRIKYERGVPELSGDISSCLDGILALADAEWSHAGCPALHCRGSALLPASTSGTGQQQALRRPVTEGVEHMGWGTDVAFHLPLTTP